ncbi:MAG TPA: hypothetical protein VIJ75_08080 [Hanamia sp.]
MIITTHINFACVGLPYPTPINPSAAIVGVRADGFVAGQSPTTRK